MTALYIIGTLLVLLFFLFTQNIRIYINVSSDKNFGTKIYVSYLFYKLNIMPENKKVRKSEESKKKKQIKSKQEPQEQPTEIIQLDIFKAYDVILQTVKKLLLKFKKRLKIKIKNFEVAVSSEDAMKTALLYGTVSQSTLYLYEFLKQHFNFSADRIKVYSDFEAKKINFKISLKFYISLWYIFVLLISIAINYLKIKNNKEYQKTQDK